MIIHKKNKLLLITLCIYSTLNCSENNIKPIKNSTQLNRIITKSKKPIVVKFYTDNCPACISFEDLYNDLANQNCTKAVFTKINLDNKDNNNIAQKHKIGTIPTTLVFRPGSEESPTRINGNDRNAINKITKAIKELTLKKNVSTQESNQDITNRSEEKEEDTTTQAENKSPYTNVESIEEFDKLVESGKSVVVQLNTQNCKYCKLIEPTFKQLAIENPKVSFLMLDINDAPELRERYQFTGYPSYLIFKNGKLSQKFTGASERVLPMKIKSALGKGGNVKVVRVSEAEANNILTNMNQEEPVSETVEIQPKKVTRKRISYRK